MSWLDIILAIIILFGAIKGYKDGFLMEVFSLLAIFLGVLVGFKLLGKAMVFIADRFEMNETILPYIAFGVVFLIIVVLVSLLGKVLKSSISDSLLGRFDQAMGALVGLMKAVFLASVGIWILDSVRLEVFVQNTSGSKLLPLIADVAPTVTAWAGKVIPFFRDVF